MPLLGLLLLSCQPSARYRAGDQEKARESSESRRSLSRQKLDVFVNDWLHTPYLFGGTSRNGIDCSGFTHLAYKNVYNISIPRNAAEQFRQGSKVSRSRLRRGDLVFFIISGRNTIDHVGIYLGEDRFAHASTMAGVIISGLKESYYSENYAGACRY
jgi:lipoprotein Spr